MAKSSKKVAFEAQKLNRIAPKALTMQISGFQVQRRAGQLQVKPHKPEQVNQASDFWLKREVVEKIISKCRTLRDRCIHKLLYYGLMRRNEVRSLKIEDIDFARKRLHLQITKRSKPRTVPVLMPGVIEDVQLLIEKRKSGWVFLSKSKDGRLSNKTINDIVGDTAELAGVKTPNPRRKNMNPHIYRHSFARHLRRQKPPIAIEVLQKLLGHKDIRTTMNIYGSADMEFIEEEMARCCAVQSLGGDSNVGVQGKRD